MPKVLSQGQVESYRRDGFLFPVRAISAEEAAQCLARVDRFEAETGEKASRRLRTKAHLLMPWLADLVRHPGILDAVEDLIGPDILCWGGGIFVKRPHDPSFVSWHQDTWYWSWQPKEAVTVWLAFTDATTENGSVRYLPGSHDRPIAEHSLLANPNNLLTTSLEVTGGVDERQAVDSSLKAGEMILHHERVVHGSRPNNSDRPRVGFSIQYLATSIKEMAKPCTSATLVRGVDRFNNFEPEPRPSSDFDPVGLAAFDHALVLYREMAKSLKRGA
ncbi:MAG: phytanoyl-CoA dioxygenase family protein [Alphaproteobacteria bacterium]